jgi:CHAT domain-containing protein
MFREMPGRRGHAFAILLVVLTAVAGPAAGARQAAPQDVAKARIAEAAALIGKRAFADALKILEPLATDPAVTADARLSADVAYHTGNINFLQNEYPKALASLDKSIGLCRRLPDRACEARAMFRLVQTYKNQSQYAIARERGEALIALAQELKDTGLEARSRTVQGGILDLMGQFRAALESYQAAERLYAGATTVPALQLMNETAITYKNLGNYDAALTLYARAIEGYQALGERLAAAPAIFNSGNLYRLLGQDDRALEFYQRALALGREFNDRRAIGIALSSLGSLLFERGDPVRAMAMFSEQLALTQAMGNRNEQSIALHNIGDVHVSRGEFDEGVKQYESALTIQREIGARVREATTLVALAEARLKQGEAAAAAAAAASSLAIARDAASPDLEWRALHVGAKAARLQNQPAEAILKLKASAAIINDLRANVSTDSGKIGFVDGRQAVFHDLASVLVAGGRGEDALEAAEAGRARAFADLLAQRQVQGKPAERQQLDALRTSLDQAARAVGPPAAAGVRGGTVDDRLAALRADHGELASLLTADSPTSSEIKTIAGRLRATLVEYLVTEQELLAWVVTPDGVVHAVATRVPGRKVESLIGDFRGLLAGDTAGAAASPKLTSLARELDALLLAPIARHLPRSPGDLVIVVPQGPLAVLPFAALLDAKNQPAVARHTLAFAPAISVFRYTAAKRTSNAAATRSALILADAAGPAEAAMPPLPGAREEGRLVAKRLAGADVQLLEGPAATESAFKRAASDRRVVHIATHGVISATRPLASSLLLAPGGGEDGYLRVDEIFSLSLSADLVVLSGCSTGLGRASGDGVIGLGRAFIYAGTPAVIVSQWDVSDRATAFLMDRFYQALAAGGGPAAALRTAQLAARARYPNPALWAAFVAIGEPR